MLKSSLCDYSNPYIFLNGSITISREPADATDTNKRIDKSNKELIFKNCAAFTHCIKILWCRCRV